MDPGAVTQLASRKYAWPVDALPLLHVHPSVPPLQGKSALPDSSRSSNSSSLTAFIEWHWFARMNGSFPAKSLKLLSPQLSQQVAAHHCINNHNSIWFLCLSWVHKQMQLCRMARTADISTTNRFHNVPCKSRLTAPLVLFSLAFPGLIGTGRALVRSKFSSFKPRSALRGTRLESLVCRASRGAPGAILHSLGTVLSSFPRHASQTFLESHVASTTST